MAGALRQQKQAQNRSRGSASQCRHKPPYVIFVSGSFVRYTVLGLSTAARIHAASDFS
jgi:hypothetical protein